MQVAREGKSAINTALVRVPLFKFFRPRHTLEAQPINALEKTALGNTGAYKKYEILICLV